MKVSFETLKQRFRALVNPRKTSERILMQTSTKKNRAYLFYKISRFAFDWYMPQNLQVPGLRISGSPCISGSTFFSMSTMSWWTLRIGWSHAFSWQTWLSVKIKCTQTLASLATEINSNMACHMVSFKRNSQVSHLGDAVPEEDTPLLYVCLRSPRPRKLLWQPLARNKDQETKTDLVIESFNLSWTCFAGLPHQGRSLARKNCTSFYMMHTFLQWESPGWRQAEGSPKSAGLALPAAGYRSP